MGRPTNVAPIIQNSSDGQEQGSWPQYHANDRILYLAGEVNEQTIIQIIANLIALANHDRNAPITLVVSTYGGSVDEMFSLYDVMKYLPCPVNTVGIGKIMSAGVLLLASGNKGSRLIGKNARLMIHPVSGGHAGTVFEVINETKEHVRQHELMEKLLVKETNMTKAQIEKLMKSGFDNYILAEEAVKLGIVDRIIGSDEK